MNYVEMRRQTLEAEAAAERQKAISDAFEAGEIVGRAKSNVRRFHGR